MPNTQIAARLLKRGVPSDVRNLVLELADRAARGESNFDSFYCDFAEAQEQVDIDLKWLIYGAATPCPECGELDVRKPIARQHPWIAVCASCSFIRDMQPPVSNDA